MRNNAGRRYFIKSFARGLKLLETMAEAGHPLTLSRIAGSMGITLPTAHRFLHTLQALGFVESGAHRKTYTIAPKILKLGHSLFLSSDLWRTAHPYLLRAGRLGCAVNSGELYPELCSVAAPVMDRNGTTIAALNMAVHAGRRGDEYIQEVMVPAVVTSAGRISQALGYIGDRPGGGLREGIET